MLLGFSLHGLRSLCCLALGVSIRPLIGSQLGREALLGGRWHRAIFRLLHQRVDRKAHDAGHRRDGGELHGRGARLALHEERQWDGARHGRAAQGFGLGLALVLAPRALLLLGLLDGRRCCLGDQVLCLDLDAVALAELPPVGDELQAIELAALLMDVDAPEAQPRGGVHSHQRQRQPSLGAHGEEPQVPQLRASAGIAVTLLEELRDVDGASRAQVRDGVQMHGAILHANRQQLADAACLLPAVEAHYGARVAWGVEPARDGEAVFALEDQDAALDRPCIDALLCLGRQDAGDLAADAARHLLWRGTVLRGPCVTRTACLPVTLLQAAIRRHRVFNRAIAAARRVAALGAYVATGGARSAALALGSTTKAARPDAASPSGEAALLARRRLRVVHAARFSAVGTSTTLPILRVAGFPRVHLQHEAAALLDEVEGPFGGTDDGQRAVVYCGEGGDRVPLGGVEDDSRLARGAACVQANLDLRR
mmetsp:Transcript_94983/g.245354  ORF Transcript_94983/g.245354 Transcript_94983/m.245354 type:complete len:482 (-) Transcript_94983:2004-3449(-)